MTATLRLASLLVASTGCRQLLGFEQAVALDATPSPDAPADTTTDAPAGAFCVGTAPIRPCFETAPTGDLVISVGLDTDTECPLVATLDGRETCVVAAGAITIQGKPRFTGSRPLVLVGTTQLEIGPAATLDLSSSRTDGRRGAGFPGDHCSNSPSGGMFGGSAGGTFSGRGGDGGSGNGQAGGNAPGERPASFDGGCAGGALVSSFGGFGGGAVYVISQSVLIEGKILATGGGGGGGLMGSGGAGGGSGGSIVIDGEVVAVNALALLVATGGGGGSGSCSNMGGMSGQDADANILAGGGNGPGNAGDGGEGGFQTAQAGDGLAGLVSCGGGGGGGGAGAIVFLHGHTCSTEQCFPPAVTTP